jgi:hypothetical protein
VKRALHLLCAASIVAVLAVVWSHAASAAPAGCHFACSIRHPWSSSHDTGYICHSWRCRAHRYEKGHGSSSSGSRKSGRWDNKCVKKWFYSGARWWHWRYYLGRTYVRSGMNHIGFGPSHPLCDVTGR